MRPITPTTDQRMKIIYPKHQGSASRALEEPQQLEICEIILACILLQLYSQCWSFSAAKARYRPPSEFQSILFSHFSTDGCLFIRRF